MYVLETRHRANEPRRDTAKAPPYGGDNTNASAYGRDNSNASPYHTTNEMYMTAFLRHSVRVVKSSNKNKISEKSALYIHSTVTLALN